MGVMFEEVDDLSPARVVLRMGEYGGSASRPGERDTQDLADGGLRTVRHQYQPIGEVQRFVDVVRHHHDCLARMLPHAEQDVLQLEAGR